MKRIWIVFVLLLLAAFVSLPLLLAKRIHVAQGGGFPLNTERQFFFVKDSDSYLLIPPEESGVDSSGRLLMKEGLSVQRASVRVERRKIEWKKDSKEFTVDGGVGVVVDAMISVSPGAVLGTYAITVPAVLPATPRFVPSGRRNDQGIEVASVEVHASAASALAARFKDGLMIGSVLTGVAGFVGLLILLAVAEAKKKAAAAQSAV